MTKTLATIAVTIVLFAVFFEIRIDFQFALPREIDVLDADQEARYQQCVDERDAGIHRVAFGTIDNPDVQREYLSTQKDKAKAECRKQFAAVRRTEKQPFQLKLLELEYRY